MRGWKWRAKRLCQGLLLILFLLALFAGEERLRFAQAEFADDQVEYIAPRIGSDVDKYDPEHPENLQEEQLYAKSAILIEASSGEVIFEKDADALMYPASTTKILTALLGIKAGELTQIQTGAGASSSGEERKKKIWGEEEINFIDFMYEPLTNMGMAQGSNLFEQTVTLSATAGDIPDDSSTISLEIGETINFKELLYATMVRSGNEGANLIAETVCGSIDEFVALMNRTVQAAGCTSTHFMNPNGLHANEHYSTARDMARIAQIAMQSSSFRDVAKTYSYNLSRSNLHRSRVLISASDALLNPNKEENDYYYPDAVGIKTGYHSRAGYCYVGAAERDGVALISVVLYTSRTGRWLDTIKLMDYGFSQFVSMSPMEMYEQNPIVIETSGFSMDDKDMGRLQLDLRAIENANDVHIVATRTEADAMVRNLKQVALIQYTRDFIAPVEAGDVFGTLTYYPEDGGEEVVYELLASRSIERRLNAPKTLAEIEEEVMNDPNPFPPITVELVLIVLLPVAGLFLLIRILMRLFRRTGRHKPGRVPKPGNRYFQ